MHLTRLRLAGFKTFVDPVDVPIEPGLTGIVGPNGCGKSNLVEAMRWAMGESSHKALRAAEMDDVIFAGNGRRPARNLAEVSLKIDNADRRAPAEFNAGDEIEVVRALSRGSGSSYRVNGREARARDVQTLFADVSSGARSPSLIGQGRVAEIINARPDQRRRLLEDAAGIAGLSARRHEADLRLKAAEHNLDRAEDVLAQIDSRIEALRRQARTAVRYRQFSAELRRLEQARLLLGWREAGDQVVAAESAAALAAGALATTLREQGEAARAEALAEHALPTCRATAASAAARAQGLLAELARHEAAERETRARLAEISAQIGAAGGDLARERLLGEDADRTLARLREEFGAASAFPDHAAAIEALAAALRTAEADLEALERALSDATARQADANARRGAAQRAQFEAAARCARARSEAEKNAREGALAVQALPDLAGLTEALSLAAAEAERAEAETQRADAAACAARDAERDAQTAFGAAEKRAAALGAEAATLRKLVQSNRGKADRAVFDDIQVEPGFERALAAAFGEDLDASTAAGDARRWETVDGAADWPLPDGVGPLAEHVVAPSALRRALAQTGLVPQAQGAALRHRLSPGQRLVSVEGDLWRWDGFTQSAAAEAPTARRLAERNRLDAVARAAAEADIESRRLEAGLAQVRATARTLADAQQRAGDRAGLTRRALTAARERLVEAERAHAAADARRLAREDTAARLAAALLDAEAGLARAERELAGLAASPEAEDEVARLRQRAGDARARRLQAAAEHEAERRTAADRARRGEVLRREIGDWTARRDSAATRSAELAWRIDALEAALAPLTQAPEQAALAGRRLERELQAAQEEMRRSADALATAESERTALARLARGTIEAMSAAREAVARTDERLEAARARLGEAAAAIEDAHGMTAPALARSQTGPAGDRTEIESDIARLTVDRERLGPVNLAADSELLQVQGGREALVAERDDVTQAIRQLRRGIQTLNEEGRARLLDAFGRVDGNFRKLFAILFDGGEASLELIETGDPLGAGLEVHAKPPGKRPHTLSLLSGGEQALTALALVFAVFLTCPSPICVLDEVDAPLDDANVERFCQMLATMTGETATRFLVVTHNPITMSRMDRLIGVTMAERGVSQLVTVALAEAERFREAG